MLNGILAAIPEILGLLIFAILVLSLSALMYRNFTPTHPRPRYRRNRNRKH